MPENNNSCENCPGMAFAKPSDQPTFFASMGFRVVFTILSVAILGICPLDANSNGIFSAYFMFSLPMVKEYLGYAPADKLRNFLRGIEILLHGFIVLVSLLCLVGVLGLVPINGTPYIQVATDYIIFSQKSIPMSWFWLLSCSSIVFCVFDCMIYSPTPLTTAQKVSA